MPPRSVVLLLTNGGAVSSGLLAGLQLLPAVDFLAHHALNLRLQAGVGLFQKLALFWRQGRQRLGNGGRLDGDGHGFIFLRNLKRNFLILGSHGSTLPSWFLARKLKSHFKRKLFLSAGIFIRRFFLPSFRGLPAWRFSLLPCWFCGLFGLVLKSFSASSISFYDFLFEKFLLCLRGSVFSSSLCLFLNH